MSAGLGKREGQGWGRVVLDMAGPAHHLPFPAFSLART